ncbi:hypothetical protein ACG2F4_18890 [Halalkalibaculum sp. DA3122]|uniref:hypothetical protein n=1 Tax=Halalkalibaculum sp. DA3122 TaxID=3373607 RepID=UPI00375496B5
MNNQKSKSKRGDLHRFLYIILGVVLITGLHACGSYQEQANMGEIAETGRDFLVDDEVEESYGMYSYILFSQPPNENTYDRYNALVDKFLSFSPIEDFEKYYPRDSLNVLYLPVVEMPAYPTDSDSVLAKYNYTRSKVIINTLPREYRHREAVYFVSSLKPLTNSTGIQEPYLIQDLTTIPPDLMGIWVDEVLNEFLVPRSWTENAMRKMALNLRTNIERAAEGLPTVKTALVQFFTFRPALANVQE